MSFPHSRPCKQSAQHSYSIHRLAGKPRMCVYVSVCVHVVGGVGDRLLSAVMSFSTVQLHSQSPYTFTLQYIKMALYLTPINSTPLPLRHADTLSDIPLTRNCGSPPPIPRFSPLLSQMGHHSPLTHALSLSLPTCQTELAAASQCIQSTVLCMQTLRQLCPQLPSSLSFFKAMQVTIQFTALCVKKKKDTAHYSNDQYILIIHTC